MQPWLGREKRRGVSLLWKSMSLKFFFLKQQSAKASSDFWPKQLRHCYNSRRTEDNLLEGALDGRGRDFKVLVSPSVHPLIGGDSQSSDLQINR